MSQGAPKKARTEKTVTASTQPFSSADELRTALATAHQRCQSGDPEGIKDAVTRFRNQITPRHAEEKLGVNDGRLTIIREYLERSAGGQELFEIWDRAQHDSRLHSALPLLPSVFSLILTHTAQHTHLHPLASTLLKYLIPQLRTLQGYIGGGRTDLILVAVKLMGAMADAAGRMGKAKEMREVWEGIGWGAKSMPKLLNMRRKGGRDAAKDPFARPDIRTLYLRLHLTFLSPTLCPPPLIAAHLAQRDSLVALFRGLSDDPYPVVRQFLEVWWEVWMDGRISKSAKIAVWSEGPIEQLLKLYARTSDEDDDPTHVPADTVHHFLLALCTKPGQGVCFRDDGWYPRPAATDEEDSKPRRGKVFNRILQNVLRNLRVGEDERMAELALRILEACPELVPGYWPSVQLTLEPRLSSRWIANIAFLGRVISLHVPTSTFHTSFTSPSATTTFFYRSSPPPLHPILESTLPSALSKAHLSKGLQSSAPLVQHCTALALAKCLTKLSRVVEAFRAAETALEEEGESGQWGKRRREVEREIRRRVPDVQVVIAFAQQKNAGETGNLLTESALRLLWLYQRVVPDAAQETKFDVGKLLFAAKDKGAAGLPDVEGFEALSQLHALRLLEESGDFNWSARAGSSLHSYLYSILALYLTTPQPPIRTATSSLLTRLLSTSVLFEHDPAELDIWLSALPSPSATAEHHPVLSFLDDCVQRCLKTPYRYLEDLPASAVSPLIATVVEQLTAKLAKALVGPEDARVLAAFARRLVLGLAGKMKDLAFVDDLVEKLEKAYGAEGVAETVKRQGKILARAVKALKAPPSGSSKASRKSGSPFIVDFVSLPANEQPATLTLSLRATSRPLAPTAVADLLAAIKKSPAKDDLVEILFAELDPKTENVFAALDAEEPLLSDERTLDFRDTLVHASPTALTTPAHFDLLRSSAMACSNHAVAAQLLLHRIAGSSSDVLASHVQLLAVVLKSARKGGKPEVAHNAMSSSALFELFGNAEVDSIVSTALAGLVKAALDPQGALDCEVGGRYAAQAAELLTTDTESAASLVKPWIPFFAASQLTGALDVLLDRSTATGLLEPLLSQALSPSIFPHTRLALRASFSSLLASAAALASPSLDALLVRLVARLSPAQLSTTPISELAGFAEAQWAGLADDLSSSKPKIGFPATPVRDELLAALIARSPAYRTAFGKWLAKNVDSVREHPQDVLRSVVAFAEIAGVAVQLGKADSVADLDIVRDLLPTIVRLSVLSPAPETPELPIQFALDVLDTSEQRQAFARRLAEVWPSKGRSGFSVASTRLVHHLLRSNAADYAELSGEFFESTLKWLVRRVVEEDEFEEDLHDAIDLLASVVRDATRPPKAHHVEPLLTAAVQHRLDDGKLMGLATVLLSRTQLKDHRVVSLVQSVIASPHFRTISRARSSSPLSFRAPVVRFVRACFVAHASTCCQIPTLEALLPLYSASLSEDDQCILAIFHLFEQQKRVSLATVARAWSPEGATSSTGRTLDAITALDAHAVFDTCTSFPHQLSFDVQKVQSQPEPIAKLYDPRFLLALLASLLRDDELTGLELLEAFRSNIFCVPVVGLAGRQADVRKASYHLLAVAYEWLETTTFVEQPELLYLMQYLRNAIAPFDPTKTDPPRLPRIATLFIAHSMRAVVNPATHIFPLASRFLLQRPTMDLADVPMLYSLLFSNGDDFRKDRVWILKLLRDGMRGREDWRVTRRRHTWDLLASLFEASPNDKTTRSLILEVLASITLNPSAATSLVSQTSLFTWIAQQHALQSAEAPENLSLAWLRVVYNIVCVADWDLLDRSTRGLWRTDALEVVGLALGVQADLAAVHLASCILRRFALRRTSDAHTAAPLALPRLVTRLLERLRQSEVNLSEAPSSWGHDLDLDPAPFSAHALHVPAASSPARLYTETLSRLWEVMLAPGSSLSPRDADAIAARTVALGGLEAVRLCVAGVHGIL